MYARIAPVLLQSTVFPIFARFVGLLGSASRLLRSFLFERVAVLLVIATYVKPAMDIKSGNVV